LKCDAIARRSIVMRTPEDRLQGVTRLATASRMRTRLALMIVALAAPAIAAPSTRTKPADAAPPPAPTPPRTPSPDDAKVSALLDKIAAAPDAAARTAAITELTALAPHAIDAIGDYLMRTHATPAADRRKVLALIKASIPDKTGKFSQPQRQSGKEEHADDELDWLAGLVALDTSTAGLGEVIADDVAIRALASTKDSHAAQLVFDTAFGSDTMLYRDECGRYLRKLVPASIPSLTQESQGNNQDRKRYATYQLERLDRQEPSKALAAATGDEALTVAILDVFRATHHREAVHAVWSVVDSDSPRIRAAARLAWMDYVTGPAPPPAPRKKLVLAGGKLAKRATPLWLTYRELADNELRKASSELLHEDYLAPDEEHGVAGVPIDLEAMSKKIFAYYDAERAKREGAQWTAAKAKADAGDLAAATTMLDRQLAENPERTERVEMAKLYFAWAKQLEAKSQWADASAAYSKAHGLDPKGANATDALAAHHYTLGKALQAQGKDGDPDFRRAVALKPDYAPAKTAASATASPRPLWMLYAAGGAGTLALLLFAAAMLKRRA
jgi:hypothetical protein